MRTSTGWGHVTALVLGLAALVSVALLAFAWPALNTAPRQVPVALAAPATVAGEIGQNLHAAAPGALDLVPAADRAEAVRLVEDREAYGAVVIGPEGAEALTASAGSPVVAQLLNDLAPRVGQAQESPVTVTDIVALPVDDPRGVGLAAGALPLVLGGIATAVAMSTRVSGPGRRLAGVLGVGVVGAIALVVVLRTLGVVPENFWAAVTVVALSITATAAVLLGLDRVAERPGLALGAATVLLLGNPLSGLTSAPELLPAGWGTLGQLLPPGAAGTALGSAAYFDGAGATVPLLVLGTWAVVGLVLMVLPVRRRAAPRVPARTPERSAVAAVR